MVAQCFIYLFYLFIYSLFLADNLQMQFGVQSIHGYIHKNMLINLNFQEQKTL